MDLIRFNKHIEDFEKAYFPNEKKIVGINITNDITREEEDGLIEDYLKNGIINEIIVAWKAGRLDHVNNSLVPLEQDGNYLNGYGKPMSKKEIKDFINCVSTKWVENNLDKEDKFSEIYNSLVTGASIPKNFGSVYIINLIFFLSKGKWPIYDKFAHKALKAIMMNKHPCEVYVGDAPVKTTGINKTPNKQVVNLYSEYIWMLDYLFKKHSFGTDRMVDRALWVYGHANILFDYKNL